MQFDDVTCGRLTEVTALISAPPKGRDRVMHPAVGGGARGPAGMASGRLVKFVTLEGNRRFYQPTSGSCHN